jgi:competence protein ComEC
VGTPSFQMSFFVVTALIAFYESHLALLGLESTSFISKFWHGLKSLTVTSLIASIVILPFSIYHFHTLSLQGILANLIVIPLLGSIILPGLIFGVLCEALGSWHAPLQWIYWIIEKIYLLAQEISQWPGAKLYTNHPSQFSFLICLFGLLWICLWRSGWRFLGGILLIAGLIQMLTTPSPSCYETPDQRYFVCHKNGKGYTKAPRKKMFDIQSLAHALGLSEESLEKTTLSKEAMMKEL